MRRLPRSVFVVSAVVLLSAQYAVGYGVFTHAAISLGAYNAAISAIRKHFFFALGIPEQQTFGPQKPAQAAGSGLGPFTAQGWITAGSQDEDNAPLPITFFPTALDPPSRSLLHFFDPVNNNSGLSVKPLLTLTSNASDWGVFGSGSTFFCPQLNIPPYPYCGPVLASNDFPYASTDSTKDARTHFFNGLTNTDPTFQRQEFALMFRSLGQVIHLIQDMAQPQHVRNDEHLDLSDSRSFLTQLAFATSPTLSALLRPSAYERYVDSCVVMNSNGPTLNCGSLQNVPIIGSNAQVTFSLPQFFFSEGSGRGLAEFTNSNFVSAATNCTNTIICNSSYPSPSMTGGPTNILYWQLLSYPDFLTCGSGEASKRPSLTFADAVLLCDSVVTFFSNQVVDQYTGASVQNPMMTTSSVFDLDLMASNDAPAFSLNHFNYQQQANILVPKAVDYSAGLLTYFFRGSMDTAGSASAFAIRNTSMNGNAPETMNGQFTMYYDDPSQQRQPVPGATWSLSIDGGSMSSQLSFVPPPKVCEYILVFQGALGSENGAVAGTTFPNSSPTSGCEVPEIDATSAVSAIVLLAGVLLLFHQVQKRGRVTGP